MIRRGTRVAALSVALLTGSSAWAAAPGGSSDDNLVSYEAPTTQRRGGFAMGVSSGFALVDFSGYPNRITAIGDPEQLAATGAALGTSFNLWVGGALRDWLTVGVGLAGVNALTGEYLASNFGFALHLEGYPLYALGPRWRDVGVALDGGIGSSVMYDRDDTQLENLLAYGGSASFLAASVFWEPWRFWHFSTGPAFTFGSSFSQTLTATQATLGWRFVFYGEQPKDAAPTTARAPHAAGL